MDSHITHYTCSVVSSLCQHRRMVIHQFNSDHERTRQYSNQTERFYIYADVLDLATRQYGQQSSCIKATTRTSISGLEGSWRRRHADQDLCSVQLSRTSLSGFVTVTVSGLKTQKMGKTTCLALVHCDCGLSQLKLEQHSLSCIFIFSLFLNVLTSPFCPTLSTPE